MSEPDRICACNICVNFPIEELQRATYSSELAGETLQTLNGAIIRSPALREHYRLTAGLSDVAYGLLELRPEKRVELQLAYQKFIDLLVSNIPYEQQSGPQAETGVK